jgi:hypothetical protein
MNEAVSNLFYVYVWFYVAISSLLQNFAIFLIVAIGH